MLANAVCPARSRIIRVIPGVILWRILGYPNPMGYPNPSPMPRRGQSVEKPGPRSAIWRWSGRIEHREAPPFRHKAILISMLSGPAGNIVLKPQ
jgi:hypothetical protein